MQNMFATNNALFSVNATSNVNLSSNEPISTKTEPLSPNTMYMNTYSGNIGSQLNSDNMNMFATGVGMQNSGNMKKQKGESALDFFEISKPNQANNGSDLI